MHWSGLRSIQRHCREPTLNLLNSKQAISPRLSEVYQATSDGELVDRALRRANRIGCLKVAVVRLRWAKTLCMVLSDARGQKRGMLVEPLHEKLAPRWHYSWKAEHRTEGTNHAAEWFDSSARWSVRAA